MISVAEQFTNLRDALGSVLGIFALLRWLRRLFAKVTGRPPPADTASLTADAFARFEGRPAARLLPDGTPAPQRPSRKPLLFFLVAAFGLPYLMSKAIRALAASHEREEQERLALLQQQQLQGLVDPGALVVAGAGAGAGNAQMQVAIDPSRLEFCRLLWDFTPPQRGDRAAGGAGLIDGVDLEVKKGDLVAVLSKLDPSTGQPSQWWRCRVRDGRQGYLPSNYLQTLRPASAQPASQPPAVKAAGEENGTALPVIDSAANVKTAVAASAPLSVEDFQKGTFYS